MPEISCIEDLMSLISSIQNSKGDKEVFYRGQNGMFLNAEPSIARDGYKISEDILFREFILRNPNEFHGQKTTFEKLTIMQHFGLPTRLLDIITNPLVALYFASEKHDQDDEGEFYYYSIPRECIKYYDSDVVSIVSNISKRPYDKCEIWNLKQGPNEKNEDWIERFNNEDPIQYLLHEIREEKPYFKPIIKKQHMESIWCVKPIMNSRRIIKQDGAFLLFGIKGSKKDIAAYNPAEFVPMKAKVTNKKKCRDQLSLLGITKDRLFPELDSTAIYLKEQYNRNK